MKKKDVKIGMKVVPFKKSVIPSFYGGLSKSINWKMAKSIGQEFLYVVGWEGDEEQCWILNAFGIGTHGDFFKSGDFRLYIEE